MIVGRRPLTPIMFLLPAAALYALMFLYPTFSAFYVSLHDWSGFTREMKYVGLGNFKELLGDGVFRKALLNNLFLIVVGDIVIIGLGLFFAASLSEYRGRMAVFVKSVVFFPHLLSVVGVAILWTFIYNPRWGLLNNFLSLVGLGAWRRPWLGLPNVVMWVLLVPLTWLSVGIYMLILGAAIDRIPDTYFEAARIDGAGRWQSFRFITLPLLREVLLICVVLWMISALEQFGLIYAMTAGGPANASEVIATYLFSIAFQASGGRNPIFRLGYATAMGVVLFALVLVFSILQLGLRRRESIQY